MSSDSHENIAPAADAAASPDAARKEGRRRLIRGGLAAGPVILSLGSQPVFGTGIKCMAPSGTLSAVSSQTTKHEGNCSSSLPISNWKSKCGNSSDPYYSYGGKAFHDVFFQGGSGYSYFKTSGSGVGVSKTVAEVLAAGGLGAQFACAYLNIMAGLVSFPLAGNRTPDKGTILNHIRLMWNALANGGLYEVSAGVKWGSSSVSSYLSNNRIGY